MAVSQSWCILTGCRTPRTAKGGASGGAGKEDHKSCRQGKKNASDEVRRGSDARNHRIGKNVRELTEEEKGGNKEKALSAKGYNRRGL